MASHPSLPAPWIMQWEPTKKQWFYIDPTATPPKRQWDFPGTELVVYPPPTPTPPQAPTQDTQQAATTSPPSSPEQWLASPPKPEPIPRPPAPKPTLPGYPMRVTPATRPVSPYVAPPKGKNTAASYFADAQAPLPETTVVLLQGSVTGNSGGKDVFAPPAGPPPGPPVGAFAPPPGAPPPKPSSSPAPPPPGPPPGPPPTTAPAPSPSPAPSINIPGAGDVGGLLTGILGSHSRPPTPKPSAPPSPLVPLFAIGMSQLQGRTSARPASDANTAAFVPLVDGALSLVGSKLGDGHDPLGSLIGGLNPFSGGEKRKHGNGGGAGHRPHANSFGGFGRRDLDAGGGGGGGGFGQGQLDDPRPQGFGQEVGLTPHELGLQPQYDAVPSPNAAWSPGHAHSASYGGGVGGGGEEKQQLGGIAYGGGGHWL